MPTIPSSKTRDRIQALNGSPALTKAAALRGMIPIGKELASLAAARSARQRDVAGRMNTIYAPLRDKQSAGILRTFRSRYSGHVKLGRPRVAKESPHIHLGSLGALVPPPLQYGWTWKDSSGVGVHADAATGELGVVCDSLGNDFEGSGAAAVGIYFRPVTERALLWVWSVPAFASSWFDYAYFAAAGSSAFAGVYVGRYDNSGKFMGAVVDQRNVLWDDSSHLSDSGAHEVPSRGYPMNATCLVEGASQYVIWIWCGAYAFADRTILGGAGASSKLHLTVPAIGWQLS